MAMSRGASTRSSCTEACRASERSVLEASQVITLLVSDLLTEVSTRRLRVTSPVLQCGFHVDHNAMTKILTITTYCAITLVNIGQSEGLTRCTSLWPMLPVHVFLCSCQLYSYTFRSSVCRRRLSIHQVRLGLGTPPSALHSSSRLVFSLTWSQLSRGLAGARAPPTLMSGLPGRIITVSWLLEKVVWPWR